MRSDTRHQKVCSLVDGQAREVVVTGLVPVTALSLLSPPSTLFRLRNCCCSKSSSSLINGKAHHPQPIEQARMASQSCQPHIGSQVRLLVMCVPAGFLRAESGFPREDPVCVRSGPQDLPPRRYVQCRPGFSTNPQTLLTLAHLGTSSVTPQGPPEHLQVVSKSSNVEVCHTNQDWPSIQAADRA